VSNLIVCCQNPKIFPSCPVVIWRDDYNPFVLYHSLQLKVRLNTTSIISRTVKQLHVPTLYPVLHQVSYKTVNNSKCCELCYTVELYGARGGAVGWGTAIREEGLRFHSQWCHWPCGRL